MARIKTDKKLNPTQLGIELEQAPIRVGDGYVEADTVSEEDLRTAVNNHVADDSYTDPNYVPPPDPDDEFRKALENATTIAALRDALLGTTGPGAQPRRTQP